MTRDELVGFIRNDITVGGALDINISDDEINRVIDSELKTIYELYRDSLQRKYTIVPLTLFYTPEFRANRTIQFPKCVKSVVKVNEMKTKTMNWGINDPDISFNRAFQADLWMSPMSGDTIAFRTIQWSVWSQMKNFILTDIQHHWNRNTHQLLFTGHDPRMNVYIELYEEIPLDQLSEDPWVRKWICAKVKKQVARLMGLIQAQYIGQAVLNVNMFTDEAEKDIEECTKYWDGINQPDWFIAFP